MPKNAAKNRIRQRITERVFATGAELKRNPNNWRTHPDDQRRDVAALLNVVGQVSALMGVRTPDGILLLDGHLRADIADALEVAVDLVDLKPDEQRLILALYDHTTSMAGVNASVAASLARELVGEFPGLAEQIESWASAADAAAMAADASRPVVSEDAIPAVPSDPVTQPGDLWLLGVYWECDTCGKRYEHEEGLEMKGHCPCG